MIFLAIILMGLVIASIRVHKVEAQLGTIYIRADGSIDPATANITSFDNVTYTFTADINAFIVVEKNDTMVDGAYFTVQGVGGGTGIGLSYTNNVTLQNVKVSNFSYGISLIESSHSTVTDCTASDNTEGIFLLHSSYNTITGNVASNNVGDGIFLTLSHNNTITGNNVSNSASLGIQLYSCSHNTITGNTASNNTNGIYLFDSNYNSLTGNVASNNSNAGINLLASSNNTLAGNTVSNNFDGIYLRESSNNNIVTGNNVLTNQWGIYLVGSSNNVFFHNNLIDNTNNVEVSPSDVNAWDNGIEGNCWSNYTGVDANHDGIGDTLHVISANNTDSCPLMGRFHSFNTSAGDYVDVISNSTVDGFQYFASNTTIRMHVSNVTASQTHGFCRIRVPYEIMSPPFTVTIDGANPTYWNYTLYDDGTSRWIHFEYPHSTRDIVVIPELPSVLVLPLFMIVTLVAALAYRGRRTLRS